MQKKIILTLTQLVVSFLIIYSYRIFLKEKSDLDIFLNLLTFSNLINIVWTGSVSYFFTPFIIKNNYKKNEVLFYSFILFIEIVAISCIIFFSKKLFISFFDSNINNSKIIISSSYNYLVLFSFLQLTNSLLSSIILILHDTLTSILNSIIPQLLSLILIFVIYLLHIRNTPFSLFFILSLSYMTLILFQVIRFRKDVKNMVLSLGPNFRRLLIYPFIIKTTYLIFLLLLARSNTFLQSTFALSIGAGKSSLVFYFTYFLSFIIAVIVNPIMNYLFKAQCNLWSTNRRNRIQKLFLSISKFIVTHSLFGFLLLLFICKTMLSGQIDSVILQISTMLYAYGYIINLILVATVSRLFYLNSSVDIPNWIDLISNIFLFLALYILSGSLTFDIFIKINFLYSLILVLITFLTLSKLSFLQLKIKISDFLKFLFILAFTIFIYFLSIKSLSFLIFGLLVQVLLTNYYFPIKRIFLHLKYLLNE